jgi:broad specificity phosphatase PhoE
MKWPSELLLIRHAESAYNDMKRRKDADPEHQRFCRLFAEDRSQEEVHALSLVLRKRYVLGYNDRNIPITAAGELQARATGRGMREAGIAAPEVIFVSPYRRTAQTLALMQEEWPELRTAKIYQEERIREKDHGLVEVGLEKQDELAPGGLERRVGGVPGEIRDGCLEL